MKEDSKDKILIEFGQKVRQLRMERNISQEKLAEYADLHRTYIGMIERGEKNITLLNIVKIAMALKVNKAELLK
jgi:transcriptional regulator with XRE-family HTH domain